MDRVTHESADDTEAVEGVHLGQLAAGEEMSVQHFYIEPGATVPKHDHPHEQAGYVTAGTLTFVLEDGEEVVCGPGDSYVLAGDEVHGAENRGDVPVEGVDVFSPPRTDPDWQE
ncbi:cupin domain-containing protein [Halobaculum sp. CBA1158]|uniref:cupin domain-containing protein n=1 Tax=Halobaculum sp. CBA1158 TaxID=2904243 RepID=UPI001F23FEC7|nr:cupin domain-containing protein [Halobaculum sp. CBA1158]UIP01110.1 cupin domain-containing protein [Halobaculum sp. CBA1158]